MRFSLRGAVSVIAVSVATAGTCLFTGGSAAAQPVASGTFSFTSDPGDGVGGGGSYSYGTAAGDTMSVTGSFDDRVVQINVNGANGDWWGLQLGAPTGRQLAPGTYPGATRFPDPTTPQMDFGGNGVGCNEVTGSFTINALEWGPLGYVQTLDATFEQHCEGADPAARGQVHITNPPPPPALDLGLTVSTSGTASTLNGNATLHGTLTCTKAATVFVGGDLSQVVNGSLARGSYSKQVSCTPGTPVAWTATTTPVTLVAFQKGRAEADTFASGSDDDYGKTVTVSDITTVKLTKTK